MRDLALVHPRRGYRFIHALLVQEGHRINRKKVRRIWREEHLTVTTTRRKKIRTGASVPMQAAYPDHVWTYDTDSVCFVDNPEPHRVANSTPGTRFSPTRSARIERLCQPFNRSPYDFLFDQTFGGTMLKILTLTDEFTRESLALRVAESFTSRDVKDVLQDVIAARGAPRFIRSDNGPEFIARDLGIGRTAGQRGVMSNEIGKMEWYAANSLFPTH
ncbi:DDE-type integrase/transposase/recombinase [Deinococcus soli (ex Cha et al. 2016)]|uniref:DDE-type integrase/transposase/recombinase n=1 Tax=Deinococcus soli (ex Cha et al. 2016) TaxID=1309411 RepID=UPI0036169108